MKKITKLYRPERSGSFKVVSLKNFFSKNTYFYLSDSKLKKAKKDGNFGDFSTLKNFESLYDLPFSLSLTTLN